MKTTRYVAAGSVLLAILLIAIAGVSLATKASLQTQYRPTGNEGRISGTIMFAGDAPRPKRIDVGSDEVCVSINPELDTEDTVVTDGKLANVFVYVKSGALDDYKFNAPEVNIVLEHRGCHYVPHMLGMQTNQTLSVINSDATTHNTHPIPKSNAEWNVSQTAGGPPIERQFSKPETFIPFKDNQHPWERSYLGVFTHPFFYVTDIDGKYAINGLPPGHYQLVAWHERYGEQTLEVTVGAKTSNIENFTFNAGSTAGSNFSSSAAASPANQ